MRVQPLAESKQYQWPDYGDHFDPTEVVPENGACVTVWHLGCGSAHYINGKFMFASIGRGPVECTGVTAWQYSEQYATFEERLENGRQCMAMAGGH